nr:hypothetical protein [Methanosarcina barkeri]
MITENLGFLIHVFTIIFVVVNPISGVVTFISLTSKVMDEKKTKSQKSQPYLRA